MVSILKKIHIAYSLNRRETFIKTIFTRFQLWNLFAYSVTYLHTYFTFTKKKYIHISHHFNYVTAHRVQNTFFSAKKKKEYRILLFKLNSSYLYMYLCKGKTTSMHTFCAVTSTIMFHFWFLLLLFCLNFWFLLLF